MFSFTKITRAVRHAHKTDTDTHDVRVESLLSTPAAPTDTVRRPALEIPPEMSKYETHCSKFKSYRTDQLIESWFIVSTDLFTDSSLLRLASEVLASLHLYITHAIILRTTA